LDFLLQYRDPLFGLIVFFALIFIISFFSYLWAFYRLQKQQTRIDKFFERFTPKTELSQEYKERALLAEALVRRGEFEKAILLYNSLKEGADFKEKMRLLEKIGDLYAKAGFLGRSIKIYEEILFYQPRKPRVLRKLLLIFEKIGERDKIEEIISILQELGAYKSERDYFFLNKLIAQDKEEEVANFYLKKGFPRGALGYLFKKNPSLAWKVIKEKDILKIIDILWFLPPSVIKTHTPLLKEIYTAKGYVQEAKSSKIFELDILINYPNATLEFEYLCPKCKNLFPFEYRRCGKCATIQEPKVELIITKKRKSDEESLII